MKTKVEYTCEVCGESYDNEEEALECEKKPVTHDELYGIVGRLGIIKIVKGPYKGQILRAYFCRVAPKYWGCPDWERYWHTLLIQAGIENEAGEIVEYQTFPFDYYEIVYKYGDEYGK